MTYLKYTFLLLAVAFVSCKTAQNNSDPIKLRNTSWYLISQQKGEEKEQFYAQAYKIEFTDKEVSLQLDKNACSGNFTFKKNSLNFINEGLVCSKMCCDSKLGEQLPLNLGTSLKVSRLGDEGLQFKNENYTFILNKSRPKVEHPKLIGSTWYMQKMFEEDKEIKAAEPYKVYFEKERVSIHLDVNTCAYAATYEADKIKGGDGFCTEACCDSENAAKFKNAFAGEVQFAFENGQLILFNGKKRYYLSAKRGQASTQTINSSRLVGQKFKVYDLAVKKEGMAVRHATTYLVEFTENRFNIKLEKNTCTTAVSYKGETIVFEDQPGCTKVCCDSQAAINLAASFKGRFTTKKEGDYYVLENEEYKIRLEKA